MREHPVWRFSDDMDDLVPFGVNEYLPEDEGELLVLCKLTTAAGLSLPGYIAVHAYVWGVAVLTQTETLRFNPNLPEDIPETENAIRVAYNIPDDEPILPLHYNCEFKFRDEPPLVGYFDPRRKRGVPTKVEESPDRG